MHQYTSPKFAAGQKSGETAGRKPRPVCLVLRLHDPKRPLHHLILLPITSKMPAAGRLALEIPEMERRRANLTRFVRAWVIVDEYNYDVAEHSFHFDAEAILGAFSPAFLRRVARGLRENLGKGAARIDRTA